MVLSTRGRPEAHKTLLGINNATMMTIASLPGQKILFTFLSAVQHILNNLFTLLTSLTLLPYLPYLPHLPYLLPFKPGCSFFNE